MQGTRVYVLAAAAGAAALAAWSLAWPATTAEARDVERAASQPRDRGAEIEASFAARRAAPRRVATEPRREEPEDAPREESPAPKLSTAQIAAAIAALRDDAIRGNATRASDILYDAKCATRALLKALDSDDEQQRVLAADVLASPYHLWSMKRAPRRWLEVLVEALQYKHRRILHFNRPFRALRGRAAGAKHALERGMLSADRQQRFLCAYLLGVERIPTDLALLCKVLVPHLRDNDVHADAVMSGNALRRAGPLVLPFLARHVSSLDVQGRMLAARIRFRLEHPGVRDIDAIHAPLPASFRTRHRHPLLLYNSAWDVFPDFTPRSKR